MYERIHLMKEPGVDPISSKAVSDGIREVLLLAQASKVALVDYGEKRLPLFRDGSGNLYPWRSVDWYIEEGKKQSLRKTQLNVGALLNLLASEPWRVPHEEGPYYNVLVLRSDLYLGDHSNQFVIGASMKDVGVVISIHRFLGIEGQRDRFECIKTGVMHKMGHMFGLIPPGRRSNVQNTRGWHCSNKCCMRQGIMPNDWLVITKDRVNNGAFCAECLRDLRAYFAVGH